MDIKDKIQELEHQVNNLPSDYVTRKNIKGNIYYYHRFYENNKRIKIEI